MFNLIVTVLAIVIMIAVAIAGLSYLGPAFENAASKAVAAQLVNAGQQFAGAEALYRADNGGSYVLDATAGDAATALVAGGYLSATPAIPSVAVGPWAITAAAANAPQTVTVGLTPKAAAVCVELAKEATGVYGCSADGTSFSFNI